MVRPSQACDDLVVGHFDGSDDGVGVSRSVGARHVVSYRRAGCQGPLRERLVILAYATGGASSGDLAEARWPQGGPLHLEARRLTLIYNKL